MRMGLRLLLSAPTLPLHRFQMPSPIPPAGFTALRVVPEDVVVAHLLATTHPYEVRAGAGAAAEARVREHLERWIGDGLRFERASSGARLFDIAETVNFYVRQGLQGQGNFWRDHYVATCRRLVMDCQGRT